MDDCALSSLIALSVFGGIVLFIVLCIFTERRNIKYNSKTLETRIRELNVLRYEIDNYKSNSNISGELGDMLDDVTMHKLKIKERELMEIIEYKLKRLYNKTGGK